MVRACSFRIQEATAESSQVADDYRGRLENREETFILRDVSIFIQTKC